MGGSVPTCGLGCGIPFTRAAARYWLGVFPAVARELRRRRELALAIPDPVLRRLALQALERKRCNLEGAAALELLAGRRSSAGLVRTLLACQTICDYLDLLAEQPTPDPVLNGYQLHQALSIALAPGAAHRDYYAHHAHGEDGGYLACLVRDVQDGLAALPALTQIQAPLARAGERIVRYQCFNHGDARGSYEPFRRWARTQTPPGSGLHSWETGAGAGSTLTLYALIACAADPRLSEQAVAEIECAYFPWIGALHTLLDSLVDFHEDLVMGQNNLVGQYESAEHAAARLGLIAQQALRHAQRLPHRRRHLLILVGMASFYLSDARQAGSTHARAAVPLLRRTLGRLTAPAMAMIGARRALRRDRLPAERHAHAAHPLDRTGLDPAVRVWR